MESHEHGPAELSDLDLEPIAGGKVTVGGYGYRYGYGGLGGPWSGLGVRPGLGWGAPGIGWRRGLGFGGPWSGLGVRPGLGWGAPGLGMRRGPW